MSNFSPAMAVPMTVNMPEPMTAPMPRAVSETGPSVFFRACSGCSESWISLSMDLVAKSCDFAGGRCVSSVLAPCAHSCRTSFCGVLFSVLLYFPV
ncbi:MAG: hypothetical protein ACYCSN_16865 [Acidobacteriaceae bacterium]